MTEALARFALARALARRGDSTGALAELDAAIRLDPGNPELSPRARTVLAVAARRFRARGDPRGGAPRGGARRHVAHGSCALFRSSGARARAFAERALGRGDRGVLRYRRALGEFLTEQERWAAGGRRVGRGVAAGAARRPRAFPARDGARARLGRPAEALEQLRAGRRPRRRGHALPDGARARACGTASSTTRPSTNGGRWWRRIPATSRRGSRSAARYRKTGEPALAVARVSARARDRAGQRGGPARAGPPRRGARNIVPR